MEQLRRQYTSGEITKSAPSLTLYDQYGSMAYGIILRIIPEPELAQAVLIDLFASPQLRVYRETSSHTAGEIIRLARAKAIAAKATSISSLPATATATKNDVVPVEKLVFDLSFCQGLTLEDVAEKLQLSHTNILKFIHTYFKQLRSS